MPKNILLIFFALMFSCCMELNSNDEEIYPSKGAVVSGKKQGEWKTFYRNGKLARIENYYNDTLNGKFFSYAPDGMLRSKGTHKMGVIVDSFYLYLANGN